MRIVTSRVGVTQLAALSIVGLVGVAACGNSASSTGAGGTGGTDSTSTSSTGGASSTSTSSTSSTSSTTGTGGTGGMVHQEFVYTESNDPAGNTVLAFAHNADGSLTPLSGSPFSAGGAGLSNAGQVLGPEDSDQEVIVDATTKRLFAVNGGASSVAVFDIHADGTLAPVAGSPFPSGGSNPVSVGLHGSTLYVVNKAIDKLTAPTYVALSVGATGALTPLTGTGSSISAPLGSSPAHAYVSPDGKHLFGTDFMGPAATPSEGTLRSFTIGATGLLTPGTTDPLAIPDDVNFPPASAPPLALGLVGHPTQSILYANFVTRGEVATYTFDAAGALTYVGVTASMGPAPCWLVMSADAKWLYAVNTGDASVSVLDTSAPMAPTLQQHFVMTGTAGTSFVDASGKMQTVTSAAFQEALSPDGKRLYVIGQRVTTNVADTTSPGNLIHTLVVAADGSVSEPSAPTPLSLTVAARAQGVAVYAP